MGWEENLATKLARQHVTYPEERRFGDYISVFVIPVDFEQHMEEPARRVATVAHKLDSLTSALVAVRPYRTVIWPSYYLEVSKSASQQVSG